MESNATTSELAPEAVPADYANDFGSLASDVLGEDDRPQGGVSGGDDGGGPAFPFRDDDSGSGSDSDSGDDQSGIRRRGRNRHRAKPFGGFGGAPARGAVSTSQPDSTG